MKRSWKETGIRVAILLIGLVIAHFGVTLFLLADQGADPFNVLVQGIYRTLAQAGGGAVLTQGRTHMAICILIGLALFFVDRRYIKMGTLLCMICGGPIIDLFTGLLEGFHLEQAALAGKLVILLLGCAILAYGMTIVIQSDAGTGPNDLVAVVISERTNKKFSVVRIITDVAFVAVGWMLGGTFGVGTVVCAFLVGPVAGVFLPINKGLVQRVLERFGFGASC